MSAEQDRVSDRSTWNQLASAAILLACLTMVPKMARAIDREWDGSTSQVWNVAANWTPGAIPLLADNVFIRLDSANIALTADAFMADLTMNNGAWLQTSGQDMVITDRTILDKTTASTVQLFVESGANFIDFDTNFLDVLNGAEVDITGGILQVDFDMFVGTGSLVTGEGVIELIGGAGTSLNNNGSIIAEGVVGTSLTLQRAGALGATFDLDGTSGDGIVTVTSNTVALIVDGPLNDAFNGTLTVGDGNTVTFNNGWTLDGAAGFEGQLTMTGGVGGSATVNGLNSVISGDVDVTDSAIIDTDLTSFTSTSTVQVVAAGNLSLLGNTQFAGGSYTGAGQISQDEDATFTASTTIATGVYDLDGNSGATAVTLTNGALVTLNVTNIDDASSDTFNGSLVNDGSTLTVNIADNAWSMAGSMVLDGTDAPARIQGDVVTISGSVAVNGPSGAGINSSTISFSNTASVNVVAGGALSLGGATTYSGGSYTGAGTINQAATANVAGSTTINVATFNLDGTGTATTTIATGQTLTLNVGQIDTADDIFGGTITLNGGNIDFNVAAISWTMAGTLNMNQVGGSLGDVFAGDQMEVTGDINVSGINRIFSGSRFLPGASTTVNALGRLELQGGTFFEGGTYTGLGELEQDATAVVAATTSIDVARYDMDGVGENSQVFINAGSTFDLNVAELDDGNNSFDGQIELVGTLDVNITAGPSAWGIGLGGLLHFNQIAAPPRVQGSSIASLSGTVTGSGEGFFEVFVDFENSVVVNVPFIGDNLHLGPASTIDGGTWQGNGTLSNGGIMNVVSNTSINMATFDADGDTEDDVVHVMPGATFTINSGVIEDDGDGFDGQFIIENTARMTVLTVNTWRVEGIVQLIGPDSIVSGQDMSLEPGGRIEGTGLMGMDVTSRGTISPGASAGLIMIGSDLATLAPGTLEIEIGGNMISEYDRIIVNNGAIIDGTLDLSVIGGYAPVYGDSYTILRTNLGIIGCFSSILGADIAGPLVLAHDYTATTVVIRPTIPGDANFDGIVTGADFTLWGDGFGDACPDFGNGDFNFDGSVTGADFTLWADHFGQMAAPAATVPEPSAWTLALSSLALLIGFRSQRGRKPRRSDRRALDA